MVKIDTPWRKSVFFVSALMVSLITFSLAVFPKEGLEAAKEGLKIFGWIVLPSLLPFFVLSEIMLGLGIVHFIGVFLEPLMRPAFNVPGVGAFALSMGLAAGYPMDAVITAKFRRSGLCNRVEGERLLAFTNTADPLFMFGAVAVGMFGRPDLGVTIAIAHYLSAFSVGFIYRFYRQGQTPTKEPNQENQKGNIIRRALKEMVCARKEDGRPVGQLFGDAVTDSVSTLLMIGGFIIVFSVLVRVLEEVGVVKILLPVVEWILKRIGLNPSLSPALIKGFLEIDLGTMAAAQTTASLGDRLIIASAIIGWSGLSVHGQVISVIHETDIRIAPYIIARILHCLLGGIYTYFLLGTVKVIKILPTPVFYQSTGVLRRWYLSFTQLLIVIGFLIGVSFLLQILSRFRLVLVENKELKGKRNK